MQRKLNPAIIHLDSEGHRCDSGGEMGEPNMALTTRRHFVRQTALAAAIYACPLEVIGQSRRLFDPNEQNGALLDAATMRKLRSDILA